MKANLFSLLILILTMINTNGQDYVEKVAHIWGGVYFYGNTPLCIDMAGNLYLTAIFYDNVYFGNNESFIIPADSSDAFVARINPEGQLDWTTTVGGFGFQYIHDIEVDMEGFVYISGNINSTTIIDTATLVWNDGYSDGYVCKLATDGSLQELVRSSEAGEQGNIEMIDIDTDGNICLMGITRGYELFGFPYNPTGRSEWGYGYYVAKLDNDLNAEWIVTVCDSTYFKEHPSAYSPYNAIITDQYNNIYLAGSVDLKTFLAKIDQDGRVVWFNAFTQFGLPPIRDLFLDKFNNIYAFGRFGGMIISSDTISGDFVIVKFDSEGNYLWGSGMDIKIASFVVDRNGYAYAITMDNKGGMDKLLVFDPDGNIIYDNPMSGLTFQLFVLDPTGNVYLIGSFLSEISLSDQTLIPEDGSNFVIGQLKANELIPGASHTNNHSENAIYLYPNPAHDHVILETQKPGPYTIGIYTISGQLIFSDRFIGTTYQYDLSSFQKGIYFIAIRSKDYVRTEKIIKL